MVTIQEVGKRIRQRRKELEITQVEFAMSLQLSEDSRAMISKWENGSALPTTALIPHICDILHCDVGYLFGEYELPTRELTDIASETGLSVEAVEELIETNKSPYFQKFLPSLSWLITNGLLDAEILGAMVQLNTDAKNLAIYNADGDSLTPEEWILHNTEYQKVKNDSDVMKFRADSAFRKLLDKYFEHSMGQNVIKSKIKWEIIDHGND